MQNNQNLAIRNPVKMRNRNNPTERVVLQLLAVALNADSISGVDATVDWREVDTFARKHAILPLILQAVIALPEAQRLPEQIMKAWKSHAISTVIRNERSMRAQAEVISILQANHIACVVLKGTSVAALYPKPEMRALGDIDILIREDQCASAMDVLEGNGYHRHTGEHSFHIGMDKAGAYIEIHYAVTELPNSLIGEQIRERLSGAVDRATTASLEQHTFPVLDAPDQALSLLLHMERHMVAGGIGLRQLCDWCVFIDSLTPDAMLNRVLPVIQACRLYKFAGTLTRVCVDYLGLSASKHAWCMHVVKKTACRMLADILDSGNIMSRDLERAASSTFIKGEESVEGKQTMLSSASRNLTLSARKQFPICNKLPILLPLFWLYIPVRYLYRSMKGTRPKQSVGRIARYAMKRKRLYRKLELFKR